MDTSINEILKTLEGRVYTTRGLVNYLNNKYGGKKTQKPFNISDVCGYIYSGALPVEYGGYKIKIIENDIIGIKLYEIYQHTKKAPLLQGAFNGFHKQFVWVIPV